MFITKTKFVIFMIVMMNYVLSYYFLFFFCSHFHVLFSFKKDGDFSLTIASKNGHQELVKLLSAGEEQTEEEKEKERKASEALFVACKDGKKEEVKSLVSAGANVNLEDKVCGFDDCCDKECLVFFCILGVMFWKDDFSVLTLTFFFVFVFFQKGWKYCPHGSF